MNLICETQMALFVYESNVLIGCKSVNDDLTAMRDSDHRI